MGIIVYHIYKVITYLENKDAIMLHESQIDYELKENQMLLEDVISRWSAEDRELNMIEDQITEYYERRCMENEDITAKCLRLEANIEFGNIKYE